MVEMKLLKLLKLSYIYCHRKMNEMKVSFISYYMYEILKLWKKQEVVACL